MALMGNALGKNKQQNFQAQRQVRRRVSRLLLNYLVTVKQDFRRPGSLVGKLPDEMTQEDKQMESKIVKYTAQRQKLQELQKSNSDLSQQIKDIAQIEKGSEKQWTQRLDTCAENKDCWKNKVFLKS